jgi:hypothetical protein
VSSGSGTARACPAGQSGPPQNTLDPAAGAFGEPVPDDPHHPVAKIEGKHLEVGHMSRAPARDHRMEACLGRLLDGVRSPSRKHEDPRLCRIALNYDDIEIAEDRADIVRLVPPEVERVTVVRETDRPCRHQ